MSQSQSNLSPNSDRQPDAAIAGARTQGDIATSIAEDGEPAQISRRGFLRAGAVFSSLTLAGGVGYLWWRRQPPAHDHPRLTVAEAFANAKAQDLFLIDIRTPREWRATGVPVGSHQIDMRRDDFLTALDDVTGGERTAAIALICARGVRSARVTLALDAAGYTNVSDVPEGMLGSAAGVGWLRSNLPVARWSEQG
ncbi:rhodanese-like domain-containing protein [Phaeobacter porticola]|uniref:Rhodanese-related protein sulfurtransferase n=1 Tax=Phaeobacter porticola TaxID=1844006 RepID=A0A1L3I3H2_9RHOB|nr:rhodanese-like domain-containing protein [Phaeobacter porticola]APG46649.1 Rhodanese-related protein sulfurtransferase [Phaeobacter porticola]